MLAMLERKSNANVLVLCFYPSICNRLMLPHFSLLP